MAKRIYSIVIALCMCLNLMSLTVHAIDNESREEDIVILYTNDVHTHINEGITYSKIAALKDSYKNALLVDAGDHSQGTAYGSLDKGEAIIKLMNAAGYDVATLGNHEFNYEMNGCKNIIGWADYTYVSCNFYNVKNGVVGENVLDSYKIFEVKDKKIAFVGITTPQTISSNAPTYFQDGNGNYIYGIAGGADGTELYEAVQKAVDAANEEADIVIALGHLGVEEELKPWRSVDVIANTTGIDAFIDAHSHNTMASKIVTDKDGKDVILTQTGEYLGAVGKMTITEKGIKTELLLEEDLSDIVADQEIKAIEDELIRKVEENLGQVIGKTEVTFDNYDSEGNRVVSKQETNTGDFSTDALYYLFDSMNMDVDVAMMNGGGIRNKAITGDITYGKCKEIHTFGSEVCLQTVTGQQLLDALEWSAKGAGLQENGRFLHASGLMYKIDTSIASTVQSDDKDVWIGGPTGEYRVHDVKIYDKATNKWVAIDLNAKYNIAGDRYILRDMGDGFAMFDGTINVMDYVMEDYMVLANYVKGFDDSTIKASNSPLLQKYSGFNIDYSTINGSGRIMYEAKNDSETLDTGDSAYNFMWIVMLLVSGMSLMVVNSKKLKKVK